MNIITDIDSLEFYCKTVKWLRNQFENSIEKIDCEDIKLFADRLESELTQSLDICISIINSPFFDKIDDSFQEEIWEFHKEIINELDY